MGPPYYMRSVVDRNVLMRCMTVCGNDISGSIKEGEFLISLYKKVTANTSELWTPAQLQSTSECLVKLVERNLLLFPFPKTETISPFNIQRKCNATCPKGIYIQIYLEMNSDMLGIL